MLLCIREIKEIDDPILHSTVSCSRDAQNGKQQRKATNRFPVAFVAFFVCFLELEIHIHFVFVDQTMMLCCGYW